MTQAPSFVTRRQQADSDQLDALKRTADAARQCEQELLDAEERVKSLKKTLDTTYRKTLPDMMEAAGVDNVGLAANGNLPAMDFKLRPFYAASIAAKWDEQRKEEAFQYLESLGAGDLIKTQISISLPRGDIGLANEIIETLANINVGGTLTKAVHPQTLTAWLKELVEKHNTIPSQSDLEKIGGIVSRTVKPVERKT